MFVKGCGVSALFLFSINEYYYKGMRFIQKVSVIDGRMGVWQWRWGIL